MSQHTPAPWNVIDAYNGKTAIVSGDMHLMYIEEARGMGHRADANLKLIKAAPELLAECEAALKLLELAYAKRKNKPQVITNLRATIAKAKKGF